MAGKLYAGLTGITMETEEFDFGNGAVLRKTYAHLFSPWMMAFSPAPEGGHHPTPWRSVRGGSALEIGMELELSNLNFDIWPSVDEKLELFVLLLRLICVPTIVVPVKLDMPIQEAGKQANPFIQLFETEALVVVQSPTDEMPIHKENLDWFKENWLEIAKLIRANPLLLASIEIYDDCRLRRHTSHSMLAIWGALEHLFSPSKTELRHRVSSNIAAFLEPRGEKRLEKYKEVLKLYDQRSTAAHTTTSIQPQHFMESWMLLRNVLLKIVLEMKVPAQADFENALFCE